MYGLILFLHVLICVILVVVVLIQTGKGSGLGVFGGGSSENIFSAPSGSSFLRKVTIGLSIGFLFTTILLTIIHNRRTGRSVMERVGTQQGQ